jgi:hypothetical protein
MVRETLIRKTGDKAVTVNRNGAAEGRARGAPLKAAMVFLAVLAVVLTAVMAFASPLFGIIRSAWPVRTGASAVSGERERSGYVIKASGGKVAVFMTPGGELAVVTDVDIATLRSHDIALLENGLSVDTYEELIQTLEDFGA